MTGSEPRVPVTDYMRGHAEGMARGRDAERAQIVAFVDREFVDCSIHDVLNRIERGEHRG